jgi:hypothetical protein
MSFCKKLSGPTTTRTIEVVPGEYGAFFQVTVIDLTGPRVPFLSHIETGRPVRSFRTEKEALAYAKEQVDAAVKSGMTLY